MWQDDKEIKLLSKYKGTKKIYINLILNIYLVYIIYTYLLHNYGKY